MASRILKVKKAVEPPVRHMWTGAYGLQRVYA